MNRLVTCLLLVWFRCLLCAGQSGVTCHTDVSTLSPAVRQLMQGLNRDTVRSRARLAASTKLECRVAVDIDNSLFKQFNGNSDQIRQYVYATMNEVSAVFEREINVRLTVTHIKIWDAVDPYSAVNESLGHLNALFNWWKANQQQVPHDIVIGYTAKYGGGRAYLGSTYGGVGGAYCGVVGGRINDLDTPITAHEIGHMFGSPHTHDCSWPGGPIDRCAQLEGGCPATEDRNDMSYQVGTLMSYCQKAMTFHPLCRDLMRTVAEASRFTSMSTLPDAPAVSTTILTTTQPNPYLNWSATLRTSAYRLQVAADSAFAQVVTDTLVASPQYRSYQLSSDTPWYWRVAAVGPEAGAGPWSAVGRFRCPASGSLAAPTLRSPAFGERSVAVDGMSWYPVAGSTSYQLQFSSYSDMTYSRDITLTSTSASNVIGIPGQVLAQANVPIYWRVRAIRNGETGPWSGIGWFRQTPRVGYVRPDRQTGYTRSMPLSWVVSQEPGVRSTVELASSMSFDRLLFRLTTVQNAVGDYQTNTSLAVFDSLQDDKTYYYRIQETTAEAAGPPLYGSFTTGNQRPMWQYLNAGNSPLPASGGIRAKPQPDGSLWVATDRGLFYRKPDRKTWVSYTPASTGNKLTGLAKDVVVDRQGVVWVATERNLFRLEGGNWQKIPYPFPQSVYVGDMLIDSQGTIYVLIGGDGIIQYKKGQWTRYGTSTAFFHGAIDRNDVLWANSYNSIGRFDGTNLTFIDRATGGLPLGNVNQISVDSSGTVLAVSSGSNLAVRSAGGNWTQTNVSNIDRNASYISSLAFDQQNRLTVLTSTNLCRQIGQTWVGVEGAFLTSASGGNMALTTDRQNRYWISDGSSGVQGISVYDERNIRLSQPVRARYCTGDSLTLRVLPTFTMPASATYIAQLKMADGSYRTLPIRRSGDSIRVRFPDDLPTFDFYALRLLLPEQDITGDRTTSFRMGQLPAGQISGNPVRSLCVGDAAPLSATATAGAYQWFRDGVAIPGSTSLTHAPAQSGVYSLSVTSDGCSTVTPTVSLTMNESPVATAVPQSATQVYAPATVALVGSGGSSYQWLNGGVVVEGATEAVYKAPVSGTYAVQVTSPAGCTAVSAPVAVNVLIPLATDELPDCNLTVGPNPTSTAVVVQYTTTSRADVGLTLTDAAGRIVRAQTWPGVSAGSHRHTLDMPASAGIYILTLTVGAQRASRQLIRQ
ncbi:M12 family metallo-peptidase [Spirosoma rhododendri]|uniref:T9SS type A sorting domain-containing protein n=1 Tax=Spirosoma rhododendri TaxID=2728024 RepID=A0A7L5DGK6_9BACT|nr:M12 family metallo-peptidase [Spirosoma rhododendri]QJD77319.1 T9SS type A sorting domain-containing protein [Spirosoma rhododendri]